MILSVFICNSHYWYIQAGSSSRRRIYGDGWRCWQLL